MTTTTQVTHRVKLMMDRSVPGRVGVLLPALDVPESPLPAADILREDLPLPEVSQPEVVRYFTKMSQLNLSIDTGFYPLGSCTMKYNPKVNDAAAGLPGFAHIHPAQPASTVQGALRLLHELQGYLAEITGMDTVGLMPSAGAHGEFTGMLLFTAHHNATGQGHRDEVLAPDSAHGTNPASAAMAGYKVVEVRSDKNGNMDIAHLKSVLSDRTAGIMLTMPTTLGLFDPNTAEVCRLVHEAGGLVYGDGANMNALLGQVKLGNLGFDVMHLNLHKSFSTPHGGGGPGSGPVCVKKHLAPYLPAPVVEKNGDAYALITPEKSVGRIGSYYGNFGILVRAYTYIRALGPDGLTSVSENAVLSANYIRCRLKDVYYLPYDRVCMHEAVFSAAWQKKQGVRALDIAKRLLDHGYYAPTIYFPLIVDEALMIEPTESESLETLDEFIEVMRKIAREAKEEPETVTSAPVTTPVGRLDEARAARQPDLRWVAR